MKRTKINPYNSLLFIMLSFFVLIRLPNYSIKGIDNVSEILLLPLTLFSLLFFVKNKIKSNTLSLVAIFWGVIAFSTLINDGSITQLMRAALSSILLCTTIANGLSNNKQKTLFSLAIVLCSLTLINALTMIIFYNNDPNLRGMYQDGANDRNYYFLGQDNGTIFYTLPSILAASLYSLEKNGKISRWVLAFTTFQMIAYLIVFSGAGILSTTAMFILQLTINCTNNKLIFRRALSPHKILIIAAIVFFIVAIFRTNNPIIELLANLLNKNLTFTGRTRIWDVVLEHISRKPLLGYGIQQDYVRLSMIPYGKAHNMALQILYNGGALAIICFIITLLASCRDNNKEYDKEKTIILGYILVVLLVGNFDFYIYHSFTFMPMILFNQIAATRSKK